MSRVIEILSSVLEVPAERIVDEFSMKTAPEWDSLQQINLILTLEEEYKLAFTDDELPHLTSYEGICSALKAHGVEFD